MSGKNIPNPGGTWKSGQPKVPGSGRQKGTLNKRTLGVIEKVEKFQADPIAFLVAVMKADSRALGIDDDQYYIPLKFRFDAAKELAQYVAPRLRSIDLSNEDGSLSPAETFAAAVAASSLLRQKDSHGN